MTTKPRHRSWLKHLPAALLALAGIALTASLAVSEAAERNPLPRVSGARAVAQQARVIVRYKAGAALLRTHAAQAGMSAGPRFAQALAARHGLALHDGRMLAERMQAVQGTGIGSAALAAVLAKDPDVEWAVVDGRRHALAAPNDPDYLTAPNLAVGQWYLRANDSAVKSSINVEPAWTQATGNGVVVAVLDTGITNHPDLNGKILPGYDFVGYGGDADIPTANDNNLDDNDPHDPGDWITASENTTGEFKGCADPEDSAPSSWHGTQVSGIVGAETDNGIGMAGIARDASILPVRVLGKCGGYDSDIIPGMRWAAGLTVSGVANNPNPAQVLNLSLGSADTCSAAYAAVMDELTAAHVVVVAAAGNDGLAVGTPANCPGMVAVAGLRHVGTKVGFSNLGPEITVGAPGGNCVVETGACVYPLLSTSNDGTTTPGNPIYTDGLNHLTLGTSFSSPIVAGTVALMLDANPALTPKQVISALKVSSRPYPTTGGDAGSAACHVPDGTDQDKQDSECYCNAATCGAGMTDAGAAVSRALNGPFPVVSPSVASPTAGDTVTLSSTGTSALAGRSIASYQWAITNGANLASFVGATNGSTAQVKAAGTGNVEVQLTVTDSQGASASLRQGLGVGASSISATISATPSEPEVGDSVALSSAGSAVDAGRTIASYQWEITAGATLASFSGSTTGSSATLAANAAGSVTVKLTITDSAGQQASATRELTITQPPSGGGGGGAVAPLWGLGLALAGLALRRRPRS